jgi:hypothetical protein
MNTTAPKDQTEVDSLLAIIEAIELPVREEMSTGVYDLHFYEAMDVAKNTVLPPAMKASDHLDDARVGMGLFIDETKRALALAELNPAQRVHIATILSYIEGLADRFDKVRKPDFGR